MTEENHLPTAPVSSQKERLGLLFVDVFLLLIVSWLALGQWWPSGGDKGFWFYSALLGLVLGMRLDTPFFAKPADVILYAVSAGVSVALSRSVGPWSPEVWFAFWWVEAFFAAAFAVGVVAVLSKDAAAGWSRRVSDLAWVLVLNLGSPRLLFTMAVFFALFAFHRDSAREVGVILAGWFLVGLVPITDKLLETWRRLRKSVRSGAAWAVDGEIVAFQTPNLVLIRQARKIPVGQLLALNDPAGDMSFCLALDQVGRDEGMLLRAVGVSGVTIDEATSRMLRSQPPGSASRLEVDELVDPPDLVTRSSELVGLVAPETSPEILTFEVVRNDDLEEGRLVEVEFRERRVAYQVLTGLTKEEVVQQKNTHGYVRAQARKIGVWDPEKRLFSSVRWLPLPNSPVLLQPSERFTPTADAIGHFPGSTYGVGFKKDGSDEIGLNNLVTHNTAILGILGVGKSYLALELVDRMVAQGIKVICLDLTAQYAAQLAGLYSNNKDKAEDETLREIGQKGEEAAARNVEKGGSKRAFSVELEKQLEAFYLAEMPRRIKILNPASFEVWRQDSKPFNSQASMATLTPAEITQLVTEATLKIVAKQGMTDKARVCLVFEEAHSLIPEWSSAVSEGDKGASNGTARAILQGRKYGLGCLLITQRTANVTKTILNQCNTVFAMRSFDKTGEDFLANYLGREQAESLPGLPERHAVFFGRASSCENPVLIRLNSREDFLREFRLVHPLPTPVPTATEDFLADIEAASESEEEDDIPF
jgi:uncharacterized protein